MKTKHIPWILLFLLPIVLGGCSGAGMRFLKYFAPNIDDHRIFKTELLYPSDTPFYFKTGQSIQLPSPTLWVTKKILPDGITAEEFFENTNTVAFLFIRNDSILYENYFHGYNRTTVAQVFSVTKSWTSAMIGKAISLGHIKSIHEPVCNYLFEFCGCDKEKITINHLLQMTSGMAFKDHSTLGKLLKLYYGNDACGLANTIAVDDSTGKEWAYSSLSTMVLGMVLEKATGMRAGQFLQNGIWNEIQMENHGIMALDYKNEAKVYGGLSLTPIDLAKFGRLYLNKGNWNGKQVLPAWWVDAIRAKEPENGNPRYAYQWWVDTYPWEMEEERQDFFAGGYRGQICYVNPVENSIIIRIGKSEKGIWWGESISKLCHIINVPNSQNTADKALTYLDGKFETKKGSSIILQSQGDRIFLTGNQRDKNEVVELWKESDFSFTDKKKKLRVVVSNRKDGKKRFILEEPEKATLFFQVSEDYNQPTGR